MPEQLTNIAAAVGTTTTTHLGLAWNTLNLVVTVVGWVLTVAAIVGALLAFWAFLKGIAMPLWRLGIGLSRRKIAIIGNSAGCESLKTLLNTSKLFSSKNVFFVSSNKDLADIGKTNAALLYLENSPITLEEVLESKRPEGALVIYAKPAEITKEQWEQLDKHRNVSVCNLRGRLMSDLLALMMTTGYEK